jgi:beta-catenin-like protein 1
VEDDNDFAPGGDADYFAEEDEEGRFFGGGLTSEQKDILNIFDNAGGEGVDEVRDLVSLSDLNLIFKLCTGRRIVYHTNKTIAGQF